MTASHLLLAYGVLGGVVVGIGWSALLVRNGRGGGPAFEKFQAAVAALLVVSAASGVVLFASGARPADLLHLLYALIAIALIPLARSFLGRATGRGADAVLLAAFAGIGAVAYRLFTTG